MPLAQKIDILERILNISRRMDEIRNLDDLLIYAVDEVLQLVGAERGYIVLVNEDGSFKLQVQRKIHDSEIVSLDKHRAKRDSVSYSILEQVIQTSQSLVVEDALFDPRFAGSLSVRSMRLRSIMCAPLVTESQTTGAIYVENRTETGRFSDEDIIPLELFSKQAAIAIKNAHLYTHLETLVTERTEALLQAKREAEHAQMVAEEANQAKSIFLANMSHELRTPLNAILGYAQILNRESDKTSTQAEALATIHQSGEHLLTLINGILDLAKVESGMIELHPTAVHLRSFLDSIVATINSQARAKKLRFFFEFSPSLPVNIQADETRLRQILLNLLSNAVKFTDAGQVTFRVHESDSSNQPQSSDNALSSEMRFCFEVEDTGPGIQAIHLAKIFQPFEQAGEHKYWMRGTGLGLSISNQLVSVMGGELNVESEVGKGSIFTFEVTFPVLEPTDLIIEQAPQIIGYKRENNGKSAPPFKVLVVDDAVENRSLIVDMLRPLGFDVFEAEDGEKGVINATKVQPDVILIDRVMPVLDGLSAISRIREVATLKDVIIITTSASAFEQDRQESLDAGADAFLAKPLSLDVFLETLGTLINLTWLYTESQGSAFPKFTSSTSMANQALVPPPEEELESLYELAVFGNMRLIKQKADHIAELDEKYVSFANTIRELAHNFEEQDIIILVEQYLEKNSEDND